MARNGTRYYQIAEYYRRMIDEKELAVGEQMPTEEQICTLFQVSRITARQAMGQHAQGGYIERVQGKGSYVKAKKVGMQLNRLQGFTEEMRAKGMTGSSRVLSVKIQPCSLKVAERLGIEAGAQVISINRLRLADGEPMAVENVFIPFHLCPELARCELNGSLYRMLGDTACVSLRLVRILPPVFLRRPSAGCCKSSHPSPRCQLNALPIWKTGSRLNVFFPLIGATDIPSMSKWHDDKDKKYVGTISTRNQAAFISTV